MQWNKYKRQLAGSLLAAATGALLPGAAACAEESAATARESWERMRQTRPVQRCTEDGAACARTGSDGLVRDAARARISVGTGAPLGGGQTLTLTGQGDARGQASGSTPDKPRGEEMVQDDL